MSQVTASVPVEVVRTRSLIGAWAGVSVLQYFLAEAVVIAAWAGPEQYSRRFNYISDLGASLCGVYSDRNVCSPLHAVMNGSFLLQGLAMILVAALLSADVLGIAPKPVPRAPAAHHTALTITRVLIGAAGLGTVVAGLAPEDLGNPLHDVGGFLYFVGGGFALMVTGLSWLSLTPISWVVLSAGVLSLSSTIVFGFGPRREPGTLERLMAYPITIGFAIMGLTVALGLLRARRRARMLARAAAASATSQPPMD
jgi:hypothetical membrane protein